MTVDTGLWHKVPTYAEVVQAINKDYKVKLPARTSLQVWDSFAMSQYKEPVCSCSSKDPAVAIRFLQRPSRATLVLSG